MRDLTALFIARTSIEDEIEDLFDDWIILTSSNTWNPEGMRFPCEINTTNTSTVHLMKKDVPPESLRICATVVKNAGYIEDGGDF